MKSFIYVSQEKNVVNEERSGSDMNQTGHWERKSVAWIKNPVSKSSRPGEVVVD